MLVLLPEFQTVFPARCSVGRGDEITSLSSDSRSTIGLWVIIGERADAQTQEIVVTLVGSPGPKRNLVAQCPLPWRSGNKNLLDEFWSTLDLKNVNIKSKIADHEEWARQVQKQEERNSWDVPHLQLVWEEIERLPI